MSHDLGNKTGTCSICTINLWESTGNKPAVWPCNIAGCPYEDPDKQNRRISEYDFSATGSGLGQIDF